jgi:Integral membrane protein possibly involved in chromosome condensation
MLNMIILIFVGGAFGAMCREFVMLSVPRLADGFPMDIFVVNIVAAFLLGWPRHCSRATGSINTYTSWSAPGSWAACRRSQALSLAPWR